MEYPMHDCGHVAGKIVDGMVYMQDSYLAHDWVVCKLCGQSEYFPRPLTDEAFFAAVCNGRIGFSRAEMGEDSEGQAIVYTGWYVHSDEDDKYYPFPPMTDAEIVEANISIARIESNNEMQEHDPLNPPESYTDDWDDQCGAEEKY